MDSVSLFWIAVRAMAFLGGLAIVALTVFSAIQTFVLPRSVNVWLTRLVFLAIRRGFDLRSRRARTYEERDAVMALYAPIALLVLPLSWLVLVVAGYTVIFWAKDAGSLDQAFLLSGSSLFTLGFASVSGVPSALLVFSEAALGYFLLSLLIAYLPTMYSAFSRRESMVNMLEVRAGSPPSAIVLIQRYYRLGRMDSLHDLWVSYETWFAELEETHTSLAALAFFRSPHPDHSWVTAAGTVLDAAALVTSTVAIPRDNQADLCIRAGYLALRDIAKLFRIPFDHDPKPGDPITISRDEYDAAYDVLAAEGVPLNDREAGWIGYAGWRVNYDTVLLALAELTMAPPAPWSSDRGPLRLQSAPHRAA